MATFDIQKGILLSCMNGGEKHLEIPAGVKRIGPTRNYLNVIKGVSSSNVESLVIPEGVTEIASSAFCTMPKLKRVTLPSTLEIIEPAAFSGCTALEELTLPAGLRVIGDRAFYACGMISRLDLPSGLEKIGEYAFYNCANLQEVTGMHSGIAMGEAAFCKCGKLADKDGFVVVADTLFGYYGDAEEVTIPDSIQKISGPVFADHDKLTSVRIPAHITTLGQSMFERCKALTTVELPSALERIPRSCFGGCTALTRIDLPKSVQEIDKYAFSGCANLTEILLPDGLKIIAEGAFRACNALEEVVIPESVKELLGFAFCEKLHKINIPAKLKRIGDFDDCKKLTWLRVPENVELPYFGFRKGMLILCDGVFDRPWQAKEKKERLWNDSTVLFSIGSGETVEYKIILTSKFEKLVAFDKKGNLNWKIYDALLCGQDLKLPAPFGSFAMLCRLRWPLELEESRKLLYIENVCKNVKKLAPYVNLCPEDGFVALLEEIGALTEKNKKTLLPLMGIGEAPEPRKKAEKKPREEKPAPDGTKTPAQIKKEWNIKKLGDGTLRLNAYKGSDTVVEIPAIIGKDPVSEIGKECFSGCAWANITQEQANQRKTITSVTIPEGVVSIGDSAFFNCVALENVVFPSTLKQIEGSAFRDCSKLKNVNLSKDVQLGKEAFHGCPGLADDNGMVILNGVLFNCYKGGELVIPNTVTRIEPTAIKGLKDLTAVTFPDGLQTLPAYCISECPSVTTITIPPSVENLGYYTFKGIKATVRGYIGSSAEELCKYSYGTLTFASLGVMKEADGDFVVVRGVLREYRGKDEKVVVPDGVTVLGSRTGKNSWEMIGAFENNENLRHLVLPEGLTEIELRALSGCKNLEIIEFPDSLEDVYASSLRETLWMKNQPEGPVYAGKVLLTYKSYANAQEAPDTLVVEPGTRCICGQAMSFNKHLKKVILPEGLQRIQFSAFQRSALEELVVPATVTELGDEILEGVNLKRCTGGILCQKVKLSAKLKIFYTGDPEDTAYLVLYQPEQSWRKAVREKMEHCPQFVGPALEKLAELINAMDVLDKTAGNRVAAFVQELYKAADSQPVKAVYQALKAKAHPMVKILEADVDFMAALEGGVQEDLSLLHPVEAKIVEHLKPTPAFDRVVERIIEGVPYAETGELCAPRVLAYVVYEYIRQYDPESVKYISTYDSACTAYNWSPVADEAAASLDQSKLMEALRQLAERHNGEYWLPYARYADDKTTVSILSQMREWDHWGKYAATGRKHIIIARSGLLLNDTKAAMIHMDKVGRLETYAKLRGTNAETLRDTVLADFGFDQNREIRYDLGGNTVVVSMDTDLNLTIFDTNAGKIVKSIPKKGADAALHEKAKTAFSDLKKNIKKVITNRKHLLFADFLAGGGKPAQSWKKAYLGNPVLNSVARLVVWSQEGKTFTLTLDGAVDSQGNAYEITDAPILVAHPIEMRGEIAAWQHYFTEHGLKQPFEQVWEPAYEPGDIKPDRYEGSSLNVYRLANKEAHGIRVWGLQAYSEDYGFELNDCKMDQEGSEWRFINGITDDATFDLGKFTFDKFTRYVNHIVYLFDKWTITDRLMKDDTSVEPLLKAFTAAQIREFVKLATANGCTNVTAMLLEYQNANFAGIDPLAEFTLDL